MIGTIAHHPDLLRRWTVFGNHVLSKSTLDARSREILILRAAWLCQADYEWGQHIEIALRAGLSREEIDRVPAGADAAGWSEHDRVLLRAADELHGDQFLSDTSWQALRARFDTRQIMDLIFTVGQYTMLAMALNSFGTQLDAGLGLKGLPRS